MKVIAKVLYAVLLINFEDHKIDAIGAYESEGEAEWAIRGITFAHWGPTFPSHIEIHVIPIGRKGGTG